MGLLYPAALYEGLANLFRQAGAFGAGFPGVDFFEAGAVSRAAGVRRVVAMTTLTLLAEGEKESVRVQTSRFGRATSGDKGAPCDGGVSWEIQAAGGGMAVAAGQGERSRGFRRLFW